MPHQATTQTPTAPAPSATTGQGTTQSPLFTTPGDVYQALRAQRSVIREQISRLENQREEIVRELQQSATNEVNRKGLEERLKAIDAEIAKASQDLSAADARVAAQAAIPGATVEPARPNPWEYGPPEDVVMMGIFMTACIMFPIAIAYARRIWKRQHTTVTLSPDLADRMHQMERSLDAVALEVERIGEGQRFVTQLLASRAESATAGRPQLAEGVRDRHV